MKRPKRELPLLLALRGQRCLHVLLGLAVFYASLLLVSHLLIPLFARRLSSQRLHHAVSLGGEREAHRESASPARPSERFASFLSPPPPPPPPPPLLPLRRSLTVSGLSFQFPNSTSRFSQLHEAASHAWELGRELLRELDSAVTAAPPPSSSGANRTAEEPCPHAITLTGAELERRGGLLLLTCGLTLGSHITVVARPRRAHEERRGPAGGTVMVSQFMMELRGLRAVEGEDPPRILHFNPRLKGDWSRRPVIELNTCYRMQWASAIRCDGRRSQPDEETVDGLVKCEKWSRDDDDWLTEEAEETTGSQLLSRPIGQGKNGPVNWPFPFVEERLFVLTLTAGFEGYHISVDGRHVTSFPYRTGFVLEDATGLSLNGDINVSSIIAGSLPTLHPSFAPQRYLEMSSIWKAPPLPSGPIDLFIGVLSAGNHFGERMAVRKSWMSSIKSSSNVVARFFVAMHVRKEVNVELKKEAEFFGDIVIVPFLDHYDLVVLKTIAICEYGLRSAFAKYIMKCDDDTFVGVNSLMNVMKKIPSNRSLYMGNMNYHTKPLRHGKWAVTYEEWPEEDYPPYANGPGYIISSDIAQDIVSEFENRTLRIFKMEDVSMGMWVEQFNKTRPVEYIHSLRFCQFGCVKNYLTAHYQSPRQMICMWDKLQLGLPECCNFR